MDLLKLGLPIGFGVAVSYLWSWPIRDIFKRGYGPTLQLNRGVQKSDTSPIRNGFSAAFRVGSFYATVVALVTLGSAGLVTVLDGDPRITKGALIIALFSVAISRFLAMSYSGFMLQSLYSLALSVFAAMGYLAIVNPHYSHEIIAEAINKNPNIIQLYGAGVIITALVGEGCWYLGGKIMGRASQISYSLFREYYEGQETHKMAVYRGPMEKLFQKTAVQCIEEIGLRNLCWKTWSGDPEIAKSIRDGYCRHLTSVEGTKPFRDMNDDEKNPIEAKAIEFFQNLHAEGKFRIIMPNYPHLDGAIEKIEGILGVTPKQIPDVGNRRYLVINRRDAVISLPIPAEFSIDGSHLISETGSNFAITTTDPSRVHDCLIEFNSLWSYHND